jgi:hypothetical protein
MASSYQMDHLELISALKPSRHQLRSPQDLPVALHRHTVERKLQKLEVALDRTPRRSLALLAVD